MITNILIGDLYPHPNNPRQDLGDLTELAESIKAKGVLQNLTVVSRMRDGSPSGYTVIIGHRRLAAAKIAGLTELPCVITEMDAREQIATMLLENIQRTDLTVYEQAQGFQMMLNLEMTAAGIAEKTGFSETTIRRRIKLLELDKKEFKAATERGATLMDFAELEKIEDPKRKMKALQAIGTRNFQWTVSNAIGEEKRAKFIESVTAILKTFAQRIKTQKEANELKRVEAYYENSKDKAVTKPEDAGTRKYYYMVESHGWITLYREYNEGEKNSTAERTAEEEEREARVNSLQILKEQARSLRQEFISGFTRAKKHASDILEAAAQVLTESRWIEPKDKQVADLLCLKDGEGKYEEADLQQAILDNPEHAALAAVYSALDGDYSYYDYYGKHAESKRLDRVYAFLARLGYEMSDEEKALRDGTHELFKREDKPEDTQQQ